jgi:hypothetical protein
LAVTLILGGAKCVWADIEAALDIMEFDGVVACNDVGVQWKGNLAGWVSLHAEKLPKWVTDRIANGLSMPARIATHDQKQDKPFQWERVPYMFRGQRHSGSSGEFAAKYALEDLRFDKGVLCGIPMLNSEAHFFNPKMWEAARHYRLGWAEAKPAIGDRLRSMSGWTREQFGAPTMEWANA